MDALATPTAAPPVMFGALVRRERSRARVSGDS